MDSNPGPAAEAARPAVTYAVSRLRGTRHDRLRPRPGAVELFGMRLVMVGAMVGHQRPGVCGKWSACMPPLILAVARRSVALVAMFLVWNTPRDARAQVPPPPPAPPLQLPSRPPVDPDRATRGGLVSDLGGVVPRGTVYSAGAARRVTIDRLGLRLASFTLPPDTLLVITRVPYPPEAQHYSVTDGRKGWSGSHHGDVELRAAPASAVVVSNANANARPDDERKLGPVIQEILSHAPLVLTVRGVDIVVENVE